MAVIIVAAQGIAGLVDSSTIPLPLEEVLNPSSVAIAPLQALKRA